MTLCQMRG